MLQLQEQQRLANSLKFCLFQKRISDQMSSTVNAADLREGNVKPTLNGY